MKNLVFIFVTVLGALFMGCNNNADNPSQVLNTYDYIGEYDMQTQIVAISANGNLDTMPNLVETPVSIYLKDNQLYVFTYHFGMPNYDCEEPITLIKLPQRIQCKLDSVEDVVVNTSPIVVMNDGLIYTITNGVILGSKPILIKGCTLNSITFSRSEVFDVLMVNQEGDAKDNIACYFDYKSINKVEDIFTYYTWEVNLIFENTPFISFENQGIAGIKYQNILRKK